MAVIEVNYQTLRDMARAIDTYCDIQNREMTQVDGAVKNMLSSDWIGPDAMDFGKKWEGIDAPDSTAVKFRDSLQKYGEALRACANVYQTAQEDVYNLSVLLPRF